MDHLFRVIFYGALSLFLCVIALLPLPALAFGNVTPQPLYTGDLAQVFTYNGATNQPYRNPVSGSAGEFAGIITAHYNAAGWLVRNMSCAKHATVDRIDCRWDSNPNYSGSSWSVGNTDSFTRNGNKCPANALLVGSTCVCAADFQPSADGKSCEPYDCSDFAEGLAGSRVHFAGRVNTGCLDGCQIRGAVWGYLSSTNESWIDGPFGSSGRCEGEGGSGSSPGADPEPTPPCPANQCRGTVNGAAVCVACSTNGAAGPSTSASGATGGGGSSGGTGGTGGEGGAPTSSESQTECSGGRCTTTTTTYDGEGNPIGEETTEETQASFCEENPDVSFCKETAFSGACASGFQCEGDGVQCAIARQQHLRACQFFEPTGEAVDVGNEAANDDPRSGDHPGLSPQTFSMIGRIDSSNPLAGGCPADYGLNVMGQSIVIPFGSLCAPLQMAGQLVVAVAMLAAMMIVFRRT